MGSLCEEALRASCRQTPSVNCNLDRQRLAACWRRAFVYAIVGTGRPCRGEIIPAPFQPSFEVSHLSVASSLLTILLAAVPTLVIANGVFAQQAIALVAAVMLALAVRGADAELTSTAQLLKRFSAAILIPVVWIVVQILPLPFSSLVNPIWSATSIALNAPSLPVRISLDPGATLQGLFAYLVYVSLAVSTIIISRDRHRAETILFVLCAVTTFMSLEVLLGRLDFLPP